MYMAHPRHPFGRCDRFALYLASCIFAWALEFVFCACWRPDICPGAGLNFVELWLKFLVWKTLISAVTNGLYDFLLEQTMLCACVQDGCPRIVKCCCKGVGYMQLLIHYCVGLCFLGTSFLLLGSKHDNFKSDRWTGDLLITIRELIVGKILADIAVITLIESISFAIFRSSQMKPDTSNAKSNYKWNEPKCGGCCNPRSHLWNKFIGSEVDFDCLPKLAPTYDVDVTPILCCESLTIYSEREAKPNAIPWFFRQGGHLNRVSSCTSSDVVGVVVGAPIIVVTSGIVLLDSTQSEPAMSGMTSTGTAEPTPLAASAPAQLIRTAAGSGA